MIGNGQVHKRTDDAVQSRLAGNGHVVPPAAVEVEFVAVGLAGGAVADVGVQRVPVVGELAGPAGPGDRADPAGQGLPGTVTVITRTGGAHQLTYNGHPLYTYIGDTAAEQARGNNLNLNGGLWHEVPVSR